MQHTTDIALAHRLKTEPADGPALVAGGEDGLFVLDTCLRRLALGSADRIAGVLPGTEVFRGEAALAFLLEVITGLRSAVPGETNIAGQFRSAWSAWLAAGERDAALVTLVQQLLGDAADIRRDHLQHIGGSSYGSLVRRLVLSTGAANGGRHVLFTGAGGLAQSMLPYFERFEVAIWNYRPTRVPGERALPHFAPEEGPSAARWADHVIMTTPPDAANDGRWMRWIAEAGATSVVHLGHRRPDRIEWRNVRHAFDLDDVFDLRASQADFRSLKLARARKACAARARLRAAPGGEFRARA